MAPGQGPESGVTADQDAAAFAEALDLGLRVDQQVGTAVDQVLHVAGVAVRLRISGPGLAEVLVPALAHHPRTPVADGFDVEIRCWDAGGHAEARPWFPESALDGGTSGAARIDAERRGPHLRIRYQPDERALSLYDPARALALFCVDDPAALPYWEHGAPLRALFHWLMEDRGRCLVHAAAVGRSDGGLLIVGRGGSGKSTTALSCLGHDLGGAGTRLSYLSDDYGIVEPSPGPGQPARAHSLYSSAKLHHDQVTRLPHLSTWVTNPHPGDGDGEGDPRARPRSGARRRQGGALRGRSRPGPADRDASPSGPWWCR